LSGSSSCAAISATFCRTACARSAIMDSVIQRRRPNDCGSSATVACRCNWRYHGPHPDRGLVPLRSAVSVLRWTYALHRIARLLHPQAGAARHNRAVLPLDRRMKTALQILSTARGARSLCRDGRDVLSVLHTPVFAGLFPSSKSENGTYSTIILPLTLSFCLGLPSNMTLSVVASFLPTKYKRHRASRACSTMGVVAGCARRSRLLDIFTLSSGALRSNTPLSSAS